jgi:hypothetical protein
VDVRGTLQRSPKSNAERARSGADPPMPDFGHKNHKMRKTEMTRIE